VPWRHVGQTLDARSTATMVQLFAGGKVVKTQARNLAPARAGSPRFVQPSIVGIDAMAAWGYVKASLEVERIVENSGLSWTILRVTQFYNYCFENSSITDSPRAPRRQPAGCRR
jgi:hypothetical protein